LDPEKRVEMFRGIFYKCVLLFIFLGTQNLFVDSYWNKFDLVKTIQIIPNVGNAPHITQNYSQFGSAVANIGDLDQDGIMDLAVGAKGEGKTASLTSANYNETSLGAVYILFMNADGTGAIVIYVFRILILSPRYTSEFIIGYH
jgi:FG-GAP repeat